MFDMRCNEHGRHKKELGKSLGSSRSLLAGRIAGRGSSPSLRSKAGCQTLRVNSIVAKKGTLELKMMISDRKGSQQLKLKIICGNDLLEPIRYRAAGALKSQP
jgi:hypothetical protein